MSCFQHSTEEKYCVEDTLIKVGGTGGGTKPARKQVTGSKACGIASGIPPDTPKCQTDCQPFNFIEPRLTSSTEPNLFTVKMSSLIRT